MKHREPEKEYAQGIALFKEGKVNEAIQLFEGAHEKKYGPASTMLGLLYNEGSVVTQDVRKAKHYLDAAVDLFIDVAMYERARIYYYEEDYVSAMMLFERAAILGLARSTAFLGLMYERGLGTEKNESMAYHLYSNAATRGDMDGAVQLGLCYANGIGCERDIQAAVEIFDHLVNSDHPRGTAVYGMLILDGVVSNKSKSQALAYLMDAAESGSQEAINYLENVSCPYEYP